MSFIDGLRHRLRAWTRRAQYDRALEDEMRFHLELAAAQQSEGVARDADAKALRRFGNATYLREETRRAAGLGVLDALRGDATHLLRSLRRSPGFALVAIMTLALGIGTTTAVLSVVDHVLVHALPFRDAGALTVMLERDDRGGFRPPSYPTVADWQRDPGMQRAFEGLSFVRGDGVSIAVGDKTERALAGFVDGNFFPLLGVRPALGRVLSADDQRDGATPAVVLAYSLWQQRFGGDPSIVGRRIDVDSIPTTVVGVLPPGAQYPGFAALWRPLSQYRHKEILTRRGLHVDSRTVARFRPGVDSARAAAMTATIGAQLALAYPAEQARWSPALYHLRDEIIGNIKPMLLTLAAAAAAVLLLACANVANLLLARVAGRTREIAVRSALGASRGRIVRQLLTESLILALIGGGVGTGLAVVAVGFAKKLPAGRLPRAEELSVDHRVLLLAAAASLFTALFCGVWPALRATRPGGAETLRAGSFGSVGLRSESRLRRTLVTVQFALALMLLVGAGLLLQSFRRAAAVDVGFDPHDLLSVMITAPSGVYKTPAEAAALYTRIMDAARSVPGVVNAGFIQHFPFGSAAMPTPVEIEGRSGSDTASRQVFYRTVSASYLPTMKMSMIAGRWFGDDDMRSPSGSFVINASMASLYWPGANAVGRRITVRRSSQARADFGQPLAGTVIGVVGDVHQTSQDTPPSPEVYVPYTLETWPWGSFVIRTRDGARSVPRLQQAIMAIDPRLIRSGADGARDFALVDEMIASRLAPRKLSMALIGVFAGCALVLAAIGMYGVIAYGVSQRTREMGVRKALGATDGRIAALVVRESLMLAGAGLAIGCVGAWACGRLIKGLLFDTPQMDPLAYGATIVLLTGVALVASFFPARRATRLDPTIAMRGD
jgi:putative ABC transport system permease protein